MAANNARAVASALPVANVQALAEACNGIDGQVPERYLVAEAEAEAEAGSEEIVVAGGGGSHSEIPVVDLRKLLDTRSSEKECAKLKSACHPWGFFQLINHGVPDEVIRNLMRDVAKFFDLPLEAKKQWAQRPDSVQGYGRAFSLCPRIRSWTGQTCCTFSFSRVSRGTYASGLLTLSPSGIP